MRPILLAIALVAGVALGAVPALGARHHRAHVVARKASAHGHVPAARTHRPPLVGTLPATTSDPLPTASDTGPTTTPPSCPTAVGVNEGEYFTTPSRGSICPGAIVVQLDNVGQDDHNLQIVDLTTGTTVAAWDVLHPGKTASKRLTLAAGTYRLFCSLADHDAQGMHAVLTVG